VAAIRLTASIVAALAACTVMAPQAPEAPLPPPLELDTGPSTRLLVVAPHPDDETLAAGGLMRRVATHGGAVRVAWLTSGDGFPEGVETQRGITHPTARDFRNYGGEREFEARAAVASLAVDRGALSFLGFPDGGMCELASTYLSAKARAFKSPYTDRISPPLTEQVIRGVRYRGADVRRELERLLIEFAPTVIVIPHPEDEHPDHCSTHIFVSEALAAAPVRRRPRPRILRYLVHYGQWPLSPDAVSGANLRPPADFPPGEGRWLSLALTQDEAESKRAALLDYRSQLLIIGRFMLAFGRENELFVDGEPGSPSECWCNGENVATELPPERYRRRPRAR
jgi:LmbE family N-acetylglucosaminyl deacetylase